MDFEKKGVYSPYTLVFTERLAGVFEAAWAEPVTFHNPLQDRPFTQTVSFPA